MPVSDAIFLILNDDVDLCPFLHKIAGKTQSNIISILIFVQFLAVHVANGSRVRASMPAHYIETGTLQATTGHLYIIQLAPEKMFVYLPRLDVLCLTLGLFAITQRWQLILHP